MSLMYHYPSIINNENNVNPISIRSLVLEMNQKWALYLCDHITFIIKSWNSSKENLPNNIETRISFNITIELDMEYLYILEKSQGISTNHIYTKELNSTYNKHNFILSQRDSGPHYTNSIFSISGIHTNLLVTFIYRNKLYGIICNSLQGRSIKGIIYRSKYMKEYSENDVVQLMNNHAIFFIKHPRACYGMPNDSHIKFLLLLCKCAFHIEEFKEGIIGDDLAFLLKVEPFIEKRAKATLKPHDISFSNHKTEVRIFPLDRSITFSYIIEGKKFRRWDPDGGLHIEIRYTVETYTTIVLFPTYDMLDKYIELNNLYYKLEGIPDMNYSIRSYTHNINPEQYLEECFGTIEYKVESRDYVEYE